MDENVWTTMGWGTMLKNKLHLVTFHESVLISKWTFQTTFVHFIDLSHSFLNLALGTFQHLLIYSQILSAWMNSFLLQRNEIRICLVFSALFIRFYTFIRFVKLNLLPYKVEIYLKSFLPESKTMWLFPHPIFPVIKTLKICFVVFVVQTMDIRMGVCEH